MSVEAARKLIEQLDLNMKEDEVGDPHFADPTVHTFPLNRNGFRLIREVRSGRKLAFVDGGNQEILGAPDFSVQLNRIYASVWSNNRRVMLTLPRVEFFSATYSTFKNGEIHYNTVIVPGSPEYAEFLPTAEDLSFNSLDRSIMNGNQRADVERVASIARRFGEWKFAAHAAMALEKRDVLVMDGTLQTTFTGEGKYLKELSAVTKERGVTLSGLSKTSALFTTTGLSLLSAVSKLADEPNIEMEWYFPIAESTNVDHNVIILAVKLKLISERIFRYEIQREQFKSLTELQINEILAELVKNSSDPTFPGYPFGMMDADRFARVSYDELEYYRALLLSQISGIGKLSKFARHIHAGDAHGILNILVG